jgi:hypothetical protein
MPKGMYGADFPDVYKMFHNNLVSVSSDQSLCRGTAADPVLLSSVACIRNRGPDRDEV